VRVFAIYQLWKRGLLTDTSWSLADPVECGGEAFFGPRTLPPELPTDEFCKLFPKNLDIEVGEVESKDSTFPASYLVNGLSSRKLVAR